MPETLLVQPYDVHNQLLVSNVHPPDWANPEPGGRYNLVVLGAGTAGLISAAGAAGLGARVADAYNRTRLTPFVKGLFQKWLAWMR